MPVTKTPSAVVPGSKLIILRPKFRRDSPDLVLKVATVTRITKTLAIYGDKPEDRMPIERAVPATPRQIALAEQNIQEQRDTAARERASVQEAQEEREAARLAKRRSITNRIGKVLKIPASEITDGQRSSIDVIISDIVAAANMSEI